MINTDVYKQLAYHYDDLMPHEEYDLWLDLVLHYLKTEVNTKEPVVVDLGCGTGTLAVNLAQQIKGKVYGVDFSEDMLAVADQKARESQVELYLLEQDMTQFILPEKADLIYCFCDSLNYLLDDQAVISTFNHVQQHLNKGGLFLFDVHSLYKFKEVFHRNSFAYNTEELSYIWESEYNHEKEIVTHDLTFFIRQEDNTYVRFDETHRQKWYSIEKLQGWLEESGFDILALTGDFTREAPRDQSERLFFVARHR